MLGPGQSSASIWTPFASISTATIRPLKARCLIAWTRQAVVNSFAVVGSSIVGGQDIVQGIGDSAINNADLYDYFDETDRLIRLEYERHLIEPLGGSAIAIATIVLDNTDLRFTPNYDSTIGTALQPNRPIKLFIGFEINGQEVTIPVIEGLSLQPQEDKGARTVTIRIEDFVSFLDGIPQETSIYVDERSDTIIADILARAGIGSSNYMLDEGLNTIGFAGFDIGDYAGDTIREICEAEEGIFFQDEQGSFKFENRIKSANPPYSEIQWTIDPDDILEWQVQESSQIINHMSVTGQPRSQKGEVEIWHDGIEEVIPAGESLIIWANFEDPATSITSPSANTDFNAFTASGGAGSDITSDIDIDMDQFATAAKLTITNNNAAPAYINFLRLRGTPATVDFEIKEVYEDTESVGTYNVQQQEIDNDFIQDSDFAAELAQNIVNRYKDPLGLLRIKIRGVPQLQLRDMVRVKDMDLGTYANYRVIGIQGIFEPGSFTQILTIRQITDMEST